MTALDVAMAFALGFAVCRVHYLSTLADQWETCARGHDTASDFWRCVAKESMKYAHPTKTEDERDALMLELGESLRVMLAGKARK